MQAPRTDGFAIAFAYLTEVLRAGSPEQQRVRGLAAGGVAKIELGHGVFVMEQAYETKLRAAGFFESHRQYIDVQFVLEGEELIEVVDLGRMKARGPYEPDRDLLMYEDNTASSHLRIFPGEAAIFFPEDVHMPTLRSRAEPVLVRKCVVKVPVA